jgi:hypothetical protein
MRLNFPVFSRRFAVQKSVPICAHLWREVLLSGTPNFSLHIPHFEDHPHLHPQSRPKTLKFPINTGLLSLRSSQFLRPFTVYSPIHTKYETRPKIAQNFYTRISSREARKVRKEGMLCGEALKRGNHGVA